MKRPAPGSRKPAGSCVRQEESGTQDQDGRPRLRGLARARSLLLTVMPGLVPGIFPRGARVDGRNKCGHDALMVSQIASNNRTPRKRPHLTPAPSSPAGRRGREGRCRLRPLSALLPLMRLSLMTSAFLGTYTPN